MSQEVKINKTLSNIKEKHLIIVDLDGTLLNRDYTTLNSNNRQVLQTLQAKGHKICIATGRNYLSALPFYEKEKGIGLNTFLITYNGAYANHPLHKDIPPLKFERIANSVVREILAEKIIQENLLNVLVDSIHRKTISTSDDIYYQQIFFNGNPYVKAAKAGEGMDIFEHLEQHDCLQLVLEFPFFSEVEKMDSIILALGKYHKKSITFDWGRKMKAEKEGDTVLVTDPTKMIFKIRNVHADKFEAVKLVASHYNIPLSRTIAFGNDVNDIKMLKTLDEVGGKGVAVSNSDINLKFIASAITKLPSYEGGVAQYLEKYFQI